MPRYEEPREKRFLLPFGTSGFPPIKLPGQRPPKIVVDYSGALREAATGPKKEEEIVFRAVLRIVRPTYPFPQTVI